MPKPKSENCSAKTLRRARYVTLTPVFRSVTPPLTIRIVQISDCHLFSDARRTLYGAYPSDRLRAVVKAARDIGADVALLTGDLVHDETAAGYNLLHTLMGDLAVPWYALPGNHDVGAYMGWGAAADGMRRIEMPPWQILLLDSTVPGQPGGHIKPADVDRIAQALHAHPEQYALVCLHHHPLPVGSPWMDTMGTDNGLLLMDTLATHANARAVIFGHIHQEFAARHGHVDWFGTPSTCVQFILGGPNGAIDSRPPGFRHLVLADDGHIATTVHWVDVA